MTRIAFALAAALATTPALADGFTIFVYETPAEIALRTDTGEDGARYWAEWADYAALLGTEGVARGGAPLLPGDIAAGDLVLGGYFEIEAADQAAAARLAAAAPSAARGGEARLVRHLAMPPMAPAAN
jgi:hypothetical protein